MCADRIRSSCKLDYRESNHAFVVGRGYLWRMVFLSAFIRVARAPEPQPNDLLAEARLRLGHLGLTVIALIFVLISFWQR
jgi:hypothetical protein